MATVNHTGETLRFRGQDGRIHAWPSSSRYTLEDCIDDPNQGVEIIVARDTATNTELNSARQACDQYFSCPMFDDDGLVIGLESSDGSRTPILTHCTFRHWRDRTVIMAVGSVDGVMTSAALSLLLRAEGHHKIDVLWTQAHRVDDVRFPDDEMLDVWLVDLAVDQLDPERTARLVKHIDAGGHHLCGVIDEHDPDAWSPILGGLDLRVSPMRAASSGAVLLAHLSRFDRLPSDVAEICREADLADRGDFVGGRRTTVNAAIKSKVSDDRRRTACFEWLSGVQREGRWVSTGLGVSTRVPAQIGGWVREYEADEECRRLALEDAVEHEIHVEVPAQSVRDITALCFAAYARWPGKLIVVRVTVDGVPSTIFAEKVGREAKGLNALGALGQAGIKVRGIPGRATVAWEDEAAALAAVLEARRGR